MRRGNSDSMCPYRTHFYCNYWETVRQYHILLWLLLVKPHRWAEHTVSWRHVPMGTAHRRREPVVTIWCRVWILSHHIASTDYWDGIKKNWRPTCITFHLAIQPRPQRRVLNDKSILTLDCLLPIAWCLLRLVLVVCHVITMAHYLSHWNNKVLIAWPASGCLYFFTYQVTAL